MADDVEPGDSENKLKKKKKKDGGVGGRSKREGVCVHICLIFFLVQQKLTQHCKVTVC